ncbi:MAG TPA: hypothetical protein VJ438_05420 [Candidatus Nanoarchaeia archaeon]|nr:hypothetical protein [Candidatus Nanoarchaeia archaeon]
MSKKKKKVSHKKSRPKKSRVSTQEVEIKMQPILVDNFVALQKVMTNLASKLDDLSTQMAKMLELFELSAKSLSKRGFRLETETPKESNKEVIERLGELSEQNKIIARGLTMLHESAPQQQIPARIPPPMQQLPRLTPEKEEYKKSGSIVKKETSV